MYDRFLWSVQITNGCSFDEWGCKRFSKPTFWDRTTLTVMPEASTSTMNCLSVSGCTNTGVVVNSSFHLFKALSTSADQLHWKSYLSQRCSNLNVILDELLTDVNEPQKLLQLPMGLATAPLPSPFFGSVLGLRPWITKPRKETDLAWHSYFSAFTNSLFLQEYAPMHQGKFLICENLLVNKPNSEIFHLSIPIIALH